MWIISNVDELCINMKHVESVIYDLHTTNSGSLLFSWGNEQLHISGELFKQATATPTPPPAITTRIKLFHHFKDAGFPLLIDLTQIKVIRRTPFGLIFYRRFFNESFWNTETAFQLRCAELINCEEIYKADQSEWANCCAEIKPNQSSFNS